MSFLRKRALVLSAFALTPLLVAQSTPRRPLGVYAVVDTHGLANQQQQANPSITAARLETYFISLYQTLLGNPAIAGLALQVHWDTLNPNPPGTANAYDWSLVDDAFAQVAAWDSLNPTQAPKTLQLIVTPGFQSPAWMLSQIPSCDGLFLTPVAAPPATCGKVTFTGYQEASDGTELPLPWNPVYKNAWQTFLAALANRYGTNPAFVSIAVAGPTAASVEMTMPSNGDSTAQSQFGGIVANDVWRQLFAFHYAGMAAYQNSDQAFIDEWSAAIDTFGQLFSGLTLVATTGSNLPNFSTNFTIPPAFTGLCPNPNMQCAAVAAILSYFAEPGAGGANAKATQTSGMEAARAITPGNVGVAGVKWLSQSTAQITPSSAQILGGAQYNTSFSNAPVPEGCTSTFPPNAGDTPVGCSIPSTCMTNGCVPVSCIPQACLAPGITPASVTSFTIFSMVPTNDLISPEQAAYNVLSVYFDGTPVGGSFGGTPGAAPLNYLQIYSPDIQYATMNAATSSQVIENGVAAATTAQALLNLASQKLMQIASNILQPFIGAGLALTANGTSESINLVFPAGYAWTASSSAAWLTITSSTAGSGNGTLSFVVDANAGAGRTATITIGGYTFTIEQEASAIPGLNFVGSMPHLAAEGGWNTSLTLINKSSTVIDVRPSLFADAGGPLALPLTFPLEASSPSPLLGASIDQTLAANASLIVQASGPADVPYSEGSAQIAGTGASGSAVDGFAIFHFDPSEQEAVVPLEMRGASSYLLAFDNTNTVLTGVALQNIGSQSTSVPVILRNDAGTQIGMGTIPLNGSGHTSFVLSTQFPQTANKRGTVEFDSPSDGQISALGIRYTPPGTLTTIPVLANVGTTGGSMAHLAVNSGWQTTFVLVNTANAPASASLKFFDDNGTPLAMPLTFPQGGAASTSTAYTQNIAANASLWVQSTGSAALGLQTGSAQLVTTGNVGGFVIFRYNPNGQEAVVPLESRNPSAYLLAFDNTNGTTTGVAISSVSSERESIPVTIRDATGTIVQTSSISLNANGHASFTLADPVHGFPLTTNIHGTAEFGVPAGARISVLGIRSPPALTFTTLPALAK